MLFRRTRDSGEPTDESALRDGGRHDTGQGDAGSIVPADDEVAGAAIEWSSDATVEHTNDVDAELDDDEEEDWKELPRDPVVGWMTLVAILLLLVVVVAAGSVIYFILALRGAPRTAVERQIIAAEAAASAEPTVENYVSLGYAYLAAGRYRDALTTIERGRKVKDVSEFDLLEADVYRMEGQHERAIKTYEKAAKKNETEYQRLVKEYERRGILHLPDRRTYVSIMIGKGESLMELGRTKDALKAYEEAVTWDRTNSFALTRKGELHAKLGDVKKAKAAFEEALRYIPDYKPALDGLERLDAGAKE